MQVNKEDRSIGELFADLAKESSVLVRQEVALAKAEMTQKAGEVGKDIGFLAVGGLVLYAGLLAIIAAIIIVLGTVGVPWWLSALLVGLIVAGVGYFLVQKGLKALKQENLAPRPTIQTLKEDAEWAQEQVR
ncbi:MAG TPA: phage holin family protein [Chloroflexia bacterium]|nr:phage holin family protein [Chloroflexia bacterium]